MKENSFFKVGLVGSVVMAICCFTPVLVLLFGVLGLSAFVYLLDMVLIPMLLFFVGVLAYGVYLKKNKRVD
ncbi:MAG: mercury resistance system transport protein MerF [Nitrospinaceae bacterium]|nr:mercury resistance system transport protein MerF [Nitrospinaceae bacterium]MBT3432949.1 mercury resistance system transport protein MerF [Nitrospinaceae bacterium]MBT4095960.1 mercury resistance system transport protein MerF [Nitrospinaceae bacterium]MBT4430154.1 mercury resistance system transport protein MerF [Nitrospinaceae bacterium]MBT5366650.1 mercury resistance system transport protein MerF [Nitrospinaceae bacterium]